MKELLCLAAILAAFALVGRIDADTDDAWSKVVTQLRTEQQIAREGYARTFAAARADGEQQ